MVLEHLFPESWLEKKVGVSFLLGVLYSIIGISLAKVLFGGNAGLASVMFVSILLLPSLKKMFKKEEQAEEREKKFSLARLYLDNKESVHVYLGMFMGIFLTYYVISAVGMYWNWGVESWFREQIFLDPVISGRAYRFDAFWSILVNNWWVLLSCFLLSLISGNGATFFIVWNASAWGVIFGLRTVAASVSLADPVLGVGAVLLLIVLPHVLLEGGAYILAGIAGAVISQDVISKASNLKRFVGLFSGLFALFIVLGQLLGMMMQGPFLLVLRIALVLWFVYLLKFSFTDKKHQEVFMYSYWLFIAALVIFIIGTVVETGVLTWSGTLNNYYAASMHYFSL